MGEYAEYHLRGDVTHILAEGWDCAVFFPPCTYLTNAGNTHYYSQRRPNQIQAIEFVKSLWDSPIDRIAIENPVGVLSTEWRKPDQYIQPCWFGDPYIKKTCLWLKGLPKLEPTEMCRAEAVPWVRDRVKQYKSSEVRDPKRRGITFQGIANAMAEQWSKYLIENS